MSGQRPVLIMAGGTGGHIFPGLAVAETLRAQGVPVAWLGAAGGMETRVVPAHGIELHTVAVGGLRGKGLKTRLLAPLMLARSLAASLGVLRRLRPRSVLSMGGYVAGPGGVAARLTGVPLLVHEQNRVAGFTNRKLAHHARRVLAGFADALPGAEWVGNPVRAAIAALPAPAQRLAGRAGRPRLLVLGGSLGARALNLALPKALALLPPERRPEVLHQCGQRGLDEARAAYTQAGVEAQVVPFVEDMAGTYAWADLAVCRAGALTLAELTAAGLGAVLVPFPHAVDDHQTRNAEALVAAGAAELIQERDLDLQQLAQRLDALLHDRARLRAMAEAARALAKPDAAQAIARACLEVAA
ncbi:undecaprenyldiphospho-muramoylpentapeptide beta-N-acetylglucosaminyltransferase [Fulvimonas soli]|jgi:UDP-N-acetylglucosamine--N-acetylmuramyl-(pentapeptide) pyrophosphoryl-undecaprenol N-acetylglucosamine transferase|uniref:UDP-N-acetylglucosamine--N-acetylmuramyl-(pentapeptide) pyrophosphoryl-undecaprenol N-acetylglucosamine transferase n=1 Tax=Fulvimonas soli TaxID=155197 RepID=A0A316IE27_9GAMM|nr:undecaprenyldiphospho-muramoylpentapeptide beta-N-acetylglucosaminyltransferase [Fulvimonas soli]PWK88563.1 UDP-N-acetylglucosamine-N-acetylmuramylpentapeptide N-acetylglucosamine transferase [Fulvimonas soli]TNY27435.1 undecaprenyldiphospho-muramoylpentapeptide beta-N-acetylglucosaminyltransferase [Fulvimonas soli]